MTIEAQDEHTIWLRCGSGMGDVIGMQVCPNSGNLMIECWDGDPNSVDEPQCSLVIPPAEALALGQMLLSMATRQLIRLPEAHPREPTGPH